MNKKFIQILLLTFSSTVLAGDIDSYTNIISKIPCIGGDAVGEAGKPTGFFLAAETLRKEWKKETLVQMLRDKNPTAKALGVFCLARSYSAEFEGLTKDIKNDKTKLVIWPGGCESETLTLGEFVSKMSADKNFMVFQEKNKIK